MPRKRKAAHVYRKPHALNAAQREYLLIGLPLMEDPGQADFPTEDAERAAWEANKVELMAECGPGRRPWGYYKQELHETLIPGWWHREIEVLERHNLIGREEEIRLEHDYPLLSAKQDVNDREPPAGFREYSVETLKHTRDEWRVVSAWHAKRNRKELAAMYEARAACLARWIDEKTVATGNV